MDTETTTEKLEPVHLTGPLEEALRSNEYIQVELWGAGTTSDSSRALSPSA
jgi:hypothetical protein